MGCAASTEVSGDAFRLSVTNEPIPDRFESLEELQDVLRHQGLASTHLILGVDYTKSNKWTGRHSFDDKCLHTIDPAGKVLNPYQTVITTIGRALEPFSTKHSIPVFGFGDATTSDQSVFSFQPDGRPCHGLDEVLERYDTLTPCLELGGPTNFAPIIYEAIRRVKATNDYHVLVIIADGQVTSEKETAQAIVEASKYALSIVVVGVGDGPWDLMEHYDDALPARRFDNFQFVNFSRIANEFPDNSDVEFATSALMEIPDQFNIIQRLGYLGSMQKQQQQLSGQVY